jgi:hypothetical protein
MIGIDDRHDLVGSVADDAVRHLRRA